MNNTLIQTLRAMRSDLVRINGNTGLVASHVLISITEDIDRAIFAGIMSLDTRDGMVWGG